jgi:hypothetical protein
MAKAVKVRDLKKKDQKLASKLTRSAAPKKWADLTRPEKDELVKVMAIRMGLVSED